MSTTVTYKGETLTTVNNQTRTLLTSGKYLEDNITLTDVSGGGGEMVVITVANAYGIVAVPDTASYELDETSNNWLVTISKHSLFVLASATPAAPTGTNVTVGTIYSSSMPPEYYYYVKTGTTNGTVS